MNVDEMEAGRCLDALVAERVMGWTEVVVSGMPREGLGVPPEGDALYQVVVIWDVKLTIPSYSTDIAAAWGIVEKLATKHYITSVGWGPGRDEQCYASVQMILDRNLAADLVLNNPREMDGRGKTAPLAICRAALKLTEGK